MKNEVVKITRRKHWAAAAAFVLLGGFGPGLLEAQTYTTPSGLTTYIFDTAGTNYATQNADHTAATSLSPYTNILVNFSTAEVDNNLNLTQNIQIGAQNGTIAATGGVTTTLAGNISGTSTVIFGHADTAGTFNLAGNNSGFTGAVTINSGNLVRAASATAIAPASYALAGTLDLNGNNGSITGLTGTGVVKNTAAATTSTLVVTLNEGSNTFAGTVINGGGTTALTKQGAGTLILTGANTFTGPLTISGGTLQVGNGGTTGSIASPVVDNAALALNRSNGLTVAGNISGAGTVTQTGTGNTTLTGDNSFTGGLTIVNGGVIAGSTTALGAGDVTNDSSLSTNSTVHGLGVDVGGNYTQATAATLTLNLFGVGDNDELLLNSPGGVAQVDGNLALTTVGGFAPTPGDTFTLIATNNPVQGQFASVTTNLPGYKLSTVYSNNVMVIFGVPFSTLPTLTPNQRAVGAYLDANDVVIRNLSFASLIQNLDVLSGNPSAIGGALNQLTPVNFAQFASSLAFNNTSFFTNSLDDYLASHRGANGSFVGSVGGIDYSGLTVNDPNYLPGLQQVHSRLLAWNPAPSTGLLSDVSEADLGGVAMRDPKDMKTMTANQEEEQRWNAFVSGTAILSQDFSDVASGLGHQDLTTGAVQVGADYRVCPDFLVGAMFGYGHTDADLDNIGSKASVDTYSPALYASYAKNGWYANALGSYGLADYDQHRNVSIGTFGGTADSSPSGHQIVGNLDGGYDFHKGHWTFGPTLGVQYVHLVVDSYSETGLSGADLNVNEDQTDSLRSRLGGRVSYAFQGLGVTFVPHASASWQHDFLDQSRGITSQFSDIGGGSFLTRTPNPSRDSALLDVGLDAQIDKQWTVFLDYTAQAGQENYFGQDVEAGVKVGF